MTSHFTVGVRMRLPILLLLLTLAACKKADAPMASAEPELPPGSRAWKIRNARSAAPAVIAMGAYVIEFDSVGRPDTLETGQSSWVCMPDSPQTAANDPVCADDQAMRWVDAWYSRTRPGLTGMGVAYALQGGAVASDTDPLKMTPDSGQAWLLDGPSIYIAMPSPRSYAGLPTTRRADGPWVRFAGTPYAYIVMPAAR